MPDEELQLDGASGSFVVDGGLSCISGAYVKVSDDFLSWDAFRKYDGKVGRLSWRHFSGMWYAEFPDEEEYGFLCGPLLFQLIYSSAEEADAAAIAMAEKERKRLENENTKEAKGRRLAKEQVKLQSENADKVRKLFASLAVLQNGLLEAHHDTKVSYAAHQDLTVTCTRMQATIDTQEGKLAEAKKQKEQIMLQLETVRKARADAEARCADQVQKLLVMERRLSDSEGLGLMKDEEIRILKKARLENTQEIARLKTENQAQEETISRLSAQKKELTDELLAAGQRELRLTAQVAQLTSAMEEMQEAHELMVKQQREDLDAGREARDAAQSELDEALRQNKDMSEELEGAREAVIRLDAIEAKEEGRVEEKLITVSEAEKMRAELEAKLNEEIRFLKNQLDGLQDTVTEIADLKKELLESKQNNEKLQDVNKKRGADYQRCQEELRKERGLKNDLQTKLLCTEQDLALKTKEFNDMTTERDGLVVIRVELSLKLAHLREEEKKLQERYQSEIRLREEAQNQLVDTREKLAEADRQMRQAQESAKVNAKAKAVADKAGRESFNKMLESKQLLVTTREELQTAKADNAQLFNKTNQRILDLQAELGGIIALRQQFEDFREVAKQDQIMADEKLSTRQAKQDALQAQLAETESDLRHEGALSKHVQKRLDGQLTFDIPVAVAFFPWRLFVVAQQSRDVEKKRQLMLADIRRLKHEATSLRRRLGASHRLVEEFQRGDSASVVALTLLHDVGKSVSPAPAPAANSPVYAPPKTPPHLRQRPATAHAHSAQPLPRGPGAASVSDMFPAILDAKVDGWAQTDAVDSGEPTTPGGGGKQAADLAKTAELAVEYAKETEGYRQRNLRLQRDARLAETEVNRLSSALAVKAAQASEMERQSGTLRGCIGFLEGVVAGVRDRKQSADLREQLQRIIFRVMELESSLPITGRAVLNLSESPITTRTREMQRDILKEKARREEEGFEDLGESIAMKEEDVEDNLPAAFETLSANLSNLSLRYVKPSTRRRAGLPMRASAPSTPTSPAPAAPASPAKLLTGSLRSTNGRADGLRSPGGGRPQSAMGRL